MKNFNPQIIFLICLIVGVVVGTIFGQARPGAVIGAIAGMVLTVAARFIRTKQNERSSEKENTQE